MSWQYPTINLKAYMSKFRLFTVFSIMTLQQERKERQEGEKHQYEKKHQSFASCTCSDGDRTHNLGICLDGELTMPPFIDCMGEHSNELSHTGQGKIFFMNTYV